MEPQLDYSKSVLDRLFKNVELPAGTMQDPYYSQFKLYLYIFRLFGRIPFERNLEGELKVRYFSQIAFYCIAIFSLQLYYVYLVFLWQIPHIQKDSSFDNVISSLLVLIFLNFHYDIFLHSWWEAPTFIAYFESWKRYNVKFMAELGISLPSRLTVPIISAVPITALVFLVVICSEKEFLLSGLDWHLYWIVFSVTFNATLLSTFWYFNCLMICDTSDELNKQLIKVLNSNPYRYQVSKFRFLFLQLRTLTAELGNVLSRTNLGGMFTVFLIIVLSSYGVVMITLQGEFDRLLSLILPLVTGLLLLFIYCEGAYRVSEKINRETLKPILECKFVSLRQEVHQEIELLLDTIKNISANIAPSGLFVINRSTFVQVLGVTTSYIIVLAQFRVTQQTS